jgi:hypothetical protein
VTGPLHRCAVKGCSWRGPDPYTCPMHETVERDRQKALMPEHVVSKRQTRHR